MRVREREGGGRAGMARLSQRLSRAGPAARAVSPCPGLAGQPLAQLAPLDGDLLVQVGGLEHTREHEDEAAVCAEDLDEEADARVGHQRVRVHGTRAAAL